MRTFFSAITLLLLLAIPAGQAAAIQCKACDASCDSGLVCDAAGQCVPACATSKSCAPGEECHPLGHFCVKYHCAAGPLPGLPPRFFCASVKDQDVVFQVVSEEGISGCGLAVADTAGKPLAAGSCTGVPWKAPDSVHLYTVVGDSGGASGPVEICSGPDLWVRTFRVETTGANVTYKATVCNSGSLAGQKFRVGFWHDRAAEPAAIEMGDVFKGIVSLDRLIYCPNPKLPVVGGDPRPLATPACVDVVVPGGLRPNGTFKAWCRVDSGEFVEECRENNNGIAPVEYKLNNPDLELTSFDATVSGDSISYNVKVCNRGTAGVSKFYLDVYFHRPKSAPIVGEPGDVVKPVMNLGPGACTDLQFQRPATPNGSYTSFAMADPDDFISEPNEGNNLSKALPVQVGSGSGPGEGCTDSDKDGAGIGPTCKGVPDCNDNDPEIKPGAKEICGDKIDQDCDLTPDDGCPGVDCTDKDGDSFGVGSHCVLADCDDSNPAIHPFAPEVCGDNKDDSCNGIADDGCPGRQCVDLDGDGYGVGKGCPGPQDCQDRDFSISPGRQEVCGDGLDNDCDGVADDACSTTVDADGDGWAVGGVNPGPPDCDDSNPAVHPGAPEICGDQLDNNCNGTVDDGCPGVDCKDGDGDGWPVGKDCKVSDCDDSNPAIHPWAVEVCGDQLDNNCNETIDDGCPGVDCKDADHDGWPAGKDCKVSDCDDADGGTSAWRPEICADGRDNNCNGGIDEGCPLCEDVDGDGFGVGPKCTNWDCDDTDPKSHPGAAEECDGKDNNCNGTVDEQCDDQTGCRCEVSSPPSLPGVLLGGIFLLLAVALRRRR